MILSSPRTSSERGQSARSVYAESLVSIAIAEAECRLYLESIMMLAAGPTLKRDVARMKCDCDDFFVLFTQMLQVRGPELWRCAERLERTVAHDIAQRIDAVNLSSLQETGLAAAAVKLQDYLLEECERAVEVSRLLGFVDDFKRLSAIIKAKRTRREALIVFRLQELPPLEPDRLRAGLW